MPLCKDEKTIANHRFRIRKKLKIPERADFGTYLISLMT
jgi:hypothetical protein